MAIKLSLTQFLNFKAKMSTSAKINYLKSQVKYADYNFFSDYWLPLRQKIQQFANGKITSDELMQYAQSVSESKNKRKNYVKDTRKFLHFVAKTNPSYFEVGRSSWNYKDLLTISASPELGVITNTGKKYLLKIFYTVKKDDEKLMKQNILPTLTMMDIANKSFNSQGAIPAVLNLRNGRLIELDKSKKPGIGNQELLVDAQQIISIWDII